MPSGRLQQQFIRLWQCCEGQSQETTLNELADLLSCSRRHMRTLLNTMQQQGWLSWEAEAGRGKRSRLTFLLYRAGAAAAARGRSARAGPHRSAGTAGWRQSRRAPDAGFPSRPQLSSGSTHSAGALLPSDEKSVARHGLTPLRNAYGPANLQRPDADK